MAVKPVPEGYRTYTPYYVVDGAAEFIDFLKKAFGAEETLRMPAPANRIGHAEVRIGDSMVMLADHNPEHGPKQMNGVLYVSDVDAVFKKAVAAGGNASRQPENIFYGDRIGAGSAKWGNTPAISTHAEEVRPEGSKRRMGKRKHGRH